MTTRMQILQTLAEGAPKTDRQIAAAIGRPGPSVRRLRALMEDQGLVRLGGRRTKEEKRLVFTLALPGRKALATPNAA